MNGFSRRPPVRRVAAVVALVAAAGMVGAGPAFGRAAHGRRRSLPRLGRARGQRHVLRHAVRALEHGPATRRASSACATSASASSAPTTPGGTRATPQRPAGGRGRRVRARPRREPQTARSDGTMPRCLARARVAAGRQRRRASSGPTSTTTRGTATGSRTCASGGTSSPSARAPTRRSPRSRSSARRCATSARPCCSATRRARWTASNIHPYTGGKSPTPSLIAGGGRPPAPGRRRQAGRRHGRRLPHRAGRRGARRSRGVDERTAAVYTLRTVLEHFDDGIQRTYLRELVDEANDPNDGARELRPHAHGLLAEAGLHRAAAPARARGPGQPARRPRARPRRRPAPAETCASSSSTAPTGPPSSCSGAPPASGTGARSGSSR